MPFLALNHSTNHKINNCVRSRKRKADEDADSGMSTSPTNSPPPFATRSLARPPKKIKASSSSAQSISIARLLETLDAESLRSVLQTICERHPEIESEVLTSAPRPSVDATAEVLSQYQEKLRSAFPYGSNSTSDYAFNRVKHHLVNLIDALTDFTPHYLPPYESQTAVSLSYLHCATKVVHDLPDWDSKSNEYFKDNAYDEISRAWALVINEASKRGGGFLLHAGGWDQVLSKHNEQSRGRLQMAMSAMASNLDWIGGMNSGDSSFIRNQLLNGTYGNPSVSIGIGQN